MRRGPLQWLVTQLYRVAFRKSAKVLFQNPDDCRLFVDRRIIRSHQARVLPGSGVDLDRFRAAPLPTGQVSFLLVSRLLGDKGVREYAEAARILRHRRPDAECRLLGPLDTGNRTAIGRDELDRWIAEGILHYLGSTNDVRPFFEGASAIVLPSYREGLPRTLLEGGAMGRALIATDGPGCREVVQEGINGFLCAVRDPASLAEAMERFVDLAAADRAAMGEASRRIVQERFSEAVVIRAYLDELAQLARPQD
jgi:glycosyltransferase involved in cell wall biosynthesis